MADADLREYDQTLREWIAHAAATGDYTDSDVTATARAAATNCRGAVRFGDDPALIVRRARHWFPGIKPAGRTATEQAQALCNEGRWRRQLRQGLAQAVEARHLAAGRVGGVSGSKLVSGWALARRKESELAMAVLAAATYFEATDPASGEIVKLQLTDLIEKAEVARAAEFWAMVGGLQELVQANQGLEVSMLTLTLEPRYHPNPKRGKKSWDGTLPSDANKEMGRRWGQLRQSLAQNHGVKLAGFRASEGHRDGCPHWHALVMYPAADRAAVIEEVLKLWPDRLRLTTRPSKDRKIERYFDVPADAVGTGRVAGYSNESAQADLTVINLALNGAKSMINYVAKYVIKQGLKPQKLQIAKLDKQMTEMSAAAGLATDPAVKAEFISEINRLAADKQKLADDLEALSDEQLRHRAWRGLWGIRGLQWFGIKNSIGAWRMLRRTGTQHVPQSGVARDLWDAARAGKFADWLGLQGGLACASVPVRAAVQVIREVPTGNKSEKVVGVRVTDVGTKQVIEVRPDLLVWTRYVDQSLLPVVEPVHVPATPVHELMPVQGCLNLEVVDSVGNVVLLNSDITVITIAPSSAKAGLAPGTSPCGGAPARQKTPPATRPPRKKPTGRYRPAVITRYKT